jgi:hypothetical protein
MSMRLRFWLPGMALLVGGVITGTCHLFNFDSTRDIAHVGQYAPLGAFVHLVLFAGGLLALLGWFGYYVLQHPGVGTISLGAFVFLFLGIVSADLMPSILEFSVFPVIDEVAPYALPGLADATYRSMPVSLLLIAGRILLFAGVSAAAMTLFRSPNVRRWPVIPLALTATLQALAMLPRSPESIRNLALTALYFSMAALGIALLSARYAISAAPVVQPHSAISYEDSRPAER